MLVRVGARVEVGIGVNVFVETEFDEVRVAVGIKRVRVGRGVFVSGISSVAVDVSVGNREGVAV